MSVPLTTLSGSRRPRTSLLPPPLTLGRMRNRNEAAPCGSRSQISVLRPSRGGQRREVDGGGRLADPALDRVGGEDLQRTLANVSRTSLRCLRRREGLEALGEVRARVVLVGLQRGDDQPGGEHGAGPAAERRELVRVLTEHLRLHAAILEAPEHVLEVLERAHDRLDHIAREQRAEQLEQVPQLLAALAQLVQVLVRARVVDPAAVAHHPPVHPADPVGRHDLDRERGARLLGRRRRGQCAPRLQRGGEAAAAQRTAHPHQLAGPALLEQRSQRRQLVGALAGHLVPLEQLHVEVAQRPGDRLHPLELRPQPRARRRRVHAPQLAQHRARAADRDPQIVQELRVDVVEHALDVRLGDVRQRHQHEPRPPRPRACRAPARTRAWTARPPAARPRR